MRNAAAIVLLPCVLALSGVNSWALHGKREAQRRQHVAERRRQRAEEQVCALLAANMQWAQDAINQIDQEKRDFEDRDRARKADDLNEMEGY